MDTRQRLLCKVYSRPGLPVGLPLPEAKKRSDEFTQEINALIQHSPINTPIATDKRRSVRDREFHFADHLSEDRRCDQRVPAADGRLRALVFTRPRSHEVPAPLPEQDA